MQPRRLPRTEIPHGTTAIRRDRSQLLESNAPALRPHPNQQRVRDDLIKGFMREWLQRCILYRLPHLLEGKDPEFAAYFQRLAHEVHGVELPRQS